VSEGSDFAELFFRRFQVLLHFFELSETFFDVLIEFLLDLVGDVEQACVDPVADGIQALRSLLVQVVELGFELRRGERERGGQLGADLSEPAGLFLATRLHLFLDGGTNGREAIAQAVSDLQADGAFGLLETHGRISRGRGELGRQGLLQGIRLPCKLL
jgi:hypothetical protein